MIPISSPCSTSIQFNNTVHNFDKCYDLVVQSASLAWTLNLQTSSIQIAFSGSAPSSSGWIGWGLNPVQPQMVGTSAFIAYTASNGSNLLPYQLTSATLGGTPLACSPIDYVVQSSAVEISGTTMSMLVVLQLPNASQTTLNHVWNRGSSVSNFQPAPHSMQPNDLLGVTQIDMALGTAINVEPPGQILRNRHGIINTVGWGILLPLGVITARYLRTFADPLWFYLHVIIQCIGYALGVAGWVTGLKLGMASGGAHHQHSNIGAALFTLCTLQVMALLLRPNKDHKLKMYWNIYHHSIGFCVIILGIINVFIGFGILRPQVKWRRAYEGVLVALGTISLSLDIISRVLSRQEKNRERQLQSLHRAMVNNVRKKTNTINGTFGPTEYDLTVV